MRARKLDRLDHIDILQGTFGCASGDHAGVDPYFRYHPDDWHECARGDGGSYSGVLETVTIQSGETEDSLIDRARARARELDRELACTRCHG